MSLRFSQLAAPLRTSVIQLPEAAHSSQPLNLALSGASYLHDLGRLPRLRLGKSAVRAICLNRANNLHQKEFQHPRAEKMHVHAHPRPAVRRVVNRILAHIECRNHQNPRTKITNRHLPPFSKVSKALIWCNTCRSYHTPNFMFLLKKRSVRSSRMLGCSWPSPGFGKMTGNFLNSWPVLQRTLKCLDCWRSPVLFICPASPCTASISDGWCGQEQQHHDRRHHRIYSWYDWGRKRLIVFAKGLLSIKLEPKKGRSTQQTETYSPNSYIDTYFLYIFV